MVVAFRRPWKLDAIRRLRGSAGQSRSPSNVCGSLVHARDRIDHLLDDVNAVGFLLDGIADALPSGTISL